MQNFPLNIYEKALYTKPLSKMFDDAARANYDYFELSLDESDERLNRLYWSQNQLKKVYLSAQDSGISIFSACLSGHRRFPLGSADKEIEKKALDIMKRSIRLCSILGIRVLQVAGYDVFYEPSTESTQQQYLENLHISADLASREGIMLAIEPVETHITSVKQAMEIINIINSPWLNVYPDVANLYTMHHDPIKELTLGADHIVAVHMREAPDETYLPFGKGVLDFYRIIQTLHKIHFKGPLTVELWNQTNPQYQDIVKNANHFLRNIMNEVQKNV